MRWRILAGTAILFCIFFFNIGSFLVQTDTIQKADLIVILSGGYDRVFRAVELAQKGFAPKLAVTTDAAHKLVLKRGIPSEMVIKPAVFARSTYEEAEFIEQLLHNSPLKRVLVVSDGYHLFRARWTIKLLCRNSGAQFNFTAPQTKFMQREWWRTGDSRMFVLNELVKIGYYAIWHGLLQQDENPQWVLAFERRYNFFLHLVVG